MEVYIMEDMSIPVTITCPNCEGTGKLPRHAPQTQKYVCPRCHGNGTVIEKSRAVPLAKKELPPEKSVSDFAPHIDERYDESMPWWLRD
jgi:transposase-like protein